MDSSKEEDAPVVLDRSSRLTRGRRMTKLLDEEIEEDELFWNQDALKEDEVDDEYEEEPEVADEFDSDFNEDESEPEEEAENEADERTQTKKRLIFPGKTSSKNQNKKRAVSKIEKPSKDEASTDHSTPPEHHDTPDDTEVERTVRKSTRTSVIVRQAERDAIRAFSSTTLFSPSPTTKKVAASSTSSLHHRAPAMASTAEETITITSSNGDQEQQHYTYAAHLVTLSVLPMTLQAAFELGLFEILAKAGHGAELSPTEIAAKITSANPDAASMVDRILRLLATHSVVGCSVTIDEHGNPQRLYSLTPVSKYYVRNEDGVSLGAVVSLIQDEVFLHSWSELKNAVIEGGVPFNRAHGGVHAFEYPGLDPRFNQVFNTAMINHTTISIKKIVKSYKGFANLKQLVDVGGGLGITLKIITSTYPSIKGINFDLPHVIQDAPPYPGVEHIGGDMFEKVPKGDAIFMKWILHDWSDDHCVKLLKNCYSTIPDDGKVIVVEAVLPTVPETTNAVKTIAQGDVLMMTQNPGGKERTRDEFKALATKAGFKHIIFECFVCNLWIIEFLK